ncbi:MAG: beta-N-acetylhexosaminidase [Alteromonadaceae bacterium]|nr:beta-N-acetylhexosaminidase [Alteromonadaceae bacterium]
MLPVIFGLSGAHVTADEQSFFKDANPAGYILFARNIENPAQLRALTDSLRDLAGRDDLPILIDQEGGRIARLGPPHWRAWPAAAALVGVSDSPASSDLDRAIARVQCNYEALGLELAAMGINITCAPVLDVPQPDAHDIIGDRAFAQTPESVAKLGRACLAGLQLAGVAGVIKHIPGHGRALSDSHESLPRVAASESELASDCAPFIALADASMAMTAHVIYEAWDAEHCASVSTTVIHEQIRRHIGFDGLLISDDLDMKALSGDIPTRATAVLAAGCDIALNCWGRLEDMKGIAEQVPAMTAEATGRLVRACASLHLAHASPALNARIDELVARRE